MLNQSMLPGMSLITFQSAVCRYILVLTFRSALSTSWAAAGMGYWNQLWGQEINPLEVQLVFKQRDCGLADELFLELEGLEQLKAALPQQHYLAIDIAPKMKDKRWFLIASGQQPNGGYDLSFEGLQSYADHNVLFLIWSEPRAGHVYTQALVSPCLLIELSAGERLPVFVVDHKSSKRHRFGVERTH